LEILPGRIYEIGKRTATNCHKCSISHFDASSISFCYQNNLLDDHKSLGKRKDMEKVMRSAQGKKDTKLTQGCNETAKGKLPIRKWSEIQE